MCFNHNKKKLVPPFFYFWLRRGGGGGGEEAGNLRIMQTKKEKGLHSESIRVPAQNWVKPKKKSSLRFCPFLCLNFLPKVKGRGGTCRNFAYYSMLYTIMATQRGAMAPCPPKYAPGTSVKSGAYERIFSLI